MNQPPIPVLLVDDHLVLLESLSRTLAEYPGIQVVGIARTSEEALEQTKLHRPKVVLMDICIPGRGAFETARELQLLGGGLRILLLTGYLADVFLTQSLRMRLSGYLLKEESVDFIAEGIRRVAMGETVYSPKVESRLVFDRATQRFVAKSESDLAGLTSRQIEVLRHLSCGQSVKEIAAMMQLSQKSVDSHKYRIMNKLGIHDRVELARFAIREGLMVP